MFKSVFSNRSIIALIISNLVLLAIALYYKLPLFDILLIYWSETVVIGFFTFLKMTIVQFYKDPSKKMQLDQNSAEAKIAGAVNIFAIFIKLFLIVISVFIISVLSLFLLVLIVSIFGTKEMQLSKEFPVQEFAGFLFGVVVILFNHTISFIFNFVKKKEFTFLKAKKIIWIPFRRIFLLALVIISGALIIDQIKSDSIYVIIPYFLFKLLFDFAIESIEQKRMLA